MNKIFTLSLIIIFCFSLTSNAQRKKTTEYKIKSATGTAVGGQNMPPSTVKEMAINKAKVDALSQAGIEENINSYSDYFRSETNNSMEELFTSDILSNIRGNVKDIQVIGQPEMGFTPEGQIQITAEISCTVVKYNTSNDLEFDAWVEGIKNSKFYNDGDGLSFTIKPTIDCYVNAFMLSSESFILLPNDHEPSQLIPAYEETKFPTFNGKYILEAETDREMNRLVIVLTKLKIPYTGITDYKQISDWIMSIPPDERVIKTFAFEIVKP